ncbi:hypothetical protein EST38_g14165 [Candolleomyces aberdarensis]|uniref:Aminotransferase class I/classII large domain-containing protein n=1 Tax=Candolleomyces aberdarensis TaxID=2316362 RepID=A0A4Q2CY00_9AGAR|nr:hypothetical protein EST38_g14165 [Candolleomyces aberdarensis]
MATVSEKLPESIDLSHHLSNVSKARPLSPLKGLQKYWGRPGLISLAGGLPSPDYFPFSSVGADILLPTSFPTQAGTSNGAFSWLWNLFSSGQTDSISIPRYASKPGDLDLASILQYNMSSGHPKLREFAKEVTDKVFRPAYSDYAILAHVGNTDGWMKAVLTLCNPGEGVLTDAWTYPSALACMKPYNINPVAVAMDGEGMRADALRELLLTWDAESRGMPRPHVMYTIPVGQNPTGATMGAARKKEVYDVCVEFDVIIVEDDPYYFLQEGPYRPKDSRNSLRQHQLNATQFVEELVPSYLRFDYQGRVIRLETFSKRLDAVWVGSLAIPCLQSDWKGKRKPRHKLHVDSASKWGLDGYLRWLQGLQNQYIVRRDYLLDCLADEFDLRMGPAPCDVDCFSGCDVYTAYPKSNRSIMSEKQRLTDEPLFSFVPPTSGMYVWLKLHLDRHPKHGMMNYNDLELALWKELAEAGVLFGPGHMFAADATVQEPEDEGHFRISFSNAEFDDLKKAISIFSRVIAKFFRPSK